MIEKEITLRPILSGHSQIEFANKPKGTPYYEQILWMEDDYPFAMVHVDTFWPGQRKLTLEDKYIIYEALNDGQDVKVKVTFEMIEDE
jgi:hypothetical protein